MPRAIQLKSQFEYCIVTGQLEAGEKLPSIRGVADELGIAPATVVKAYGELERAGLVIATEGVGFFVVGTRQTRDDAQLRVHEAARRLIDDAVSLGVPPERVLQVVLQEISQKRNSRDRRQVVVLTRRMADPAGVARHIRLALADLYVDVVGVALEDVQDDYSAWENQLRKARMVVAPLFNYKDAQEVVRDAKVELIPLLMVPREDVRDRVISLPAGTSVDVVASAPEFLDGLVAALGQWHPALEVRNSIHAGSTRLRKVLSTSECVVYGTLARQKIEPLIPNRTIGIEFIYVPDDSAIRGIRRVLDAE